MMICNIAVFYLAMAVQFIGYHGIVAENVAVLQEYTRLRSLGTITQTGAYSRPAEWPLHTLLEVTASYAVRSNLILR